MEVKVDKAKLGPLELKDLGLSYKVGDIWKGEGAVVLDDGSELGLSLTVTKGSFSAGSVSYDGIGAPLGGGVFLQKIAAAIDTVPHLKFEGTIGLSAGPRVAGKTAASLTGTATFEFSDPRTIKAVGDLKVVDLPFANGSMMANSRGRVDFSGHIGAGWPGLAVNGDMAGWADAERAFNIEGLVTVEVGIVTLNGAAVVSTNGMAACGTIASIFGDYSVGFGYKWGEDPTVLSGCDFGPYRDTPRAQLTVTAGGGYEVVVGRDMPVAAFAIPGDSAPPMVTLRGPGGEVIVADPNHQGVTSEGHLVFSRESDNTTYITVAGPTAGTWTIEPHRGSSTFDRVRQADGLPKPEVTGSVTPADPSIPVIPIRPGAQTLNWKLTPVPGQVVTFVEEGPDGSQVIGTTSEASGSMSFTPRAAETGKSRIVANIEQDGLPRTNVVVPQSG